MYQRIARTQSSRKSTNAARFFWMKLSRAVHIVSCVTPKASCWVNSVCAMARRSGSSENGGTALIRSAFFSASIAHGRKRRLDDRVIPVRFKPAAPEHGAHRNIHGAAHCVGCQHLALEIRNACDRAIVAHHELVGAMARHAVLNLIADDAEVTHMRILDGKTE